MKSNKKRVLLGLSGGVDSSVSAYLLKKDGYEVDAAFMRNWEDDDGSPYCSVKEDFMDAVFVSEQLDINLCEINFSKHYKEKVFSYFLSELEAGRTPNPDILCNKEIKFDKFFRYAMEHNYDFIATGHYCRVKEIDKQYCLLKGKDENKDQSYFLHSISKESLSKTLFPLGEFKKEEVRKIASEQNLVTSNKKDSTGICFIGERPFPEFVQNYVNQNPGPIISGKGDQIGTHIGLSFYTLGQRQGLGIGGLRNYPDSPWYVLKKDITNNSLIVGQGNNNPLLFSSSLKTLNLELINKMNKGSYNLSAKIRYRQQDQVCKVEIGNDNAEVYFEEPQRAITPGQSLVLYSDDVCLGGGEIKEVN
ncbi:MAG: tRNA 2-thiouridine(34) synthase MnmA [Gammaproteobacteria bacterium]